MMVSGGNFIRDTTAVYVSVEERLTVFFFPFSFARRVIARRRRAPANRAEVFCAANAFRSSMGGDAIFNESKCALQQIKGRVHELRVGNQTASVRAVSSTWLPVK